MKNYILSSAVPLILIFVFVVTIIFFIGESEAATLNEKVGDMIGHVDSEADEVADLIALDDWGTYDYAQLIAHAAAYYDAKPMTYAAAYDFDLNLISERHESAGGIRFDPFEYIEFMGAVFAEKSRNMVLRFEPSDAPARDMHVYFRWIPDEADKPYLFVTAISNFTVANTVKGDLYKQLIVIAILAALLSIAASIAQHRARFDNSSDWNKIRERNNGHE
jgi:hypothetical protein